MENIFRKCDGYSFLYKTEAVRIKRFYNIVHFFIESICPIIGALLMNGYIDAKIVPIILIIAPLIKQLFNAFKLDRIADQMVSYASEFERLSSYKDWDAKHIDLAYKELLTREMSLSNHTINKYYTYFASELEPADIPEIVRNKRPKLELTKSFIERLKERLKQDKMELVN